MRFVRFTPDVDKIWHRTGYTSAAILSDRQFLVDRRSEEKLYAEVYNNFSLYFSPFIVRCGRSSAQDIRTSHC